MSEAVTNWDSVIHKNVRSEDLYDGATPPGDK